MSSFENGVPVFYFKGSTTTLSGVNIHLNDLLNMNLLPKTANDGLHHIKQNMKPVRYVIDI